MEESRVPQWLELARRVQSIAQMGLHYTDGVYDRQRYEQLREIAAEMAALGSGERAEDALSVFAAEHGPSTPKVDVRAAVFCDDRILLVRERSDGRWALPGGWVDVGESASEAAAREVVEEAGYEVTPTRLLAVWDKAKHVMRQDAFQIYKLVFECTLDSGEARPSIETSEVAFFRPSDLPELSTHRITATQIHRLYELRADRAAPPDWD